LYEALWMLAGRNDVAPLKYYVSTIDQFSDDGVTFNGAYGYRWRNHRRTVEDCGMNYMGDSTDQLRLIIDHLKTKPDSRRAVLHMSNVEDDLLKMDTTKDQCCNLCVMFSIREGIKRLVPDGWSEQGAAEYGKFLDMTVINRSNDAIWGMLGANVVHFSFLQEYMAACIGVEVGVYHQITNNLHVYEWNFKPEEWLAEPWKDTPNPYFRANLTPLVKDPATFDREVVEFVERHKEGSVDSPRYKEPFLNDTARRVCVAYHHYKRGDLGDALEVAGNIAADDWRIACEQWIQRRIERRVKK
jgi:thymidylate synthase